MSFRRWLVEHLPARNRSLAEAMLQQYKAEERAYKNEARVYREMADHNRELAQRIREGDSVLAWDINGEYLTAEWDHPKYGQGFFTIVPTGQGRFALTRDNLVRARAYPLGVYDSYPEAQKKAEGVVMALIIGASRDQG